MRFMVYIGCILILGSCKGPKEPVKTGEKAMIEKELVDPLERMAFINLKIQTDTGSHTNKIEVINKTFTTGHLKNNDGAAPRSDNYLTCILVEDDVNSDTVVLQHPLYKIYEYMDEKNQLKLKEAIEKEADFFLRFQLKGKTTGIKIIETLRGMRPKEIAFINLSS